MWWKNRKKNAPKSQLAQATSALQTLMEELVDETPEVEPEVLEPEPEPEQPPPPPPEVLYFLSAQDLEDVEVFRQKVHTAATIIVTTLEQLGYTRATLDTTQGYYLYFYRPPGDRSWLSTNPDFKDRSLCLNSEATRTAELVKFADAIEKHELIPRFNRFVSKCLAEVRAQTPVLNAINEADIVSGLVSIP